MTPIVFFHGFLGSCSDWDLLVSFLPRQGSYFRISLPGHSGVSPKNFEDSALYIVSEIKKLKLSEPPIFVGYSLGGRLMMYALSKYPDLASGIVVLASHFGLDSDEDKKVRLDHDAAWANTLQTLPFSESLAAWYQQALFYSFRQCELFRPVVQHRLELHNPFDLADMLLLTSLGRQPVLWDVYRQFGKKAVYLAGELDVKFLSLSYRIQTDFPECDCRILPDVGHVLHLEASRDIASIINNVFLKDSYVN